MASVTQTIPNFLGGVSDQPDDKKLPGQVKEAINVYPDPTFGLTKRPGLKYLEELADNASASVPTGGSAFDETDLDIGKWFYYNRDADEKYIGCIVGKATSAYGQIHIWNTVPDDAVVATVDTIVAGSGYSVTAAGSYLNTTSDGSGTGLTLRITSVSTGGITGLEIVDGGKGYAVDEEIIIPGGSGGKCDVATITNNVFKKCHLTYGSSTREYLNAVNASDYDFLTIRDTSIITNKTKTVTTQAAPSFTANTVATVRIHLIEYSAEYTITLVQGGTTYSATCRTRAGDTAANNADNTYFLRAVDILNDLRDGSESGDNEYAHTSAASGINGISGITATIIGNSLEISSTTAFTVSVTGGISGTALTAYQDTVESITTLAAESKNNRLVKINNTSSSSDTYYAKFVATDGTSGPGVWEETVAPDVSVGLTNSTMPHKLYNDVRNHFTFDVISYTARVVGDDTTNEHPSFNNEKIQQAFYYNNRLGFLTEDNVSMSRSGDFFNFYMTTAQTATDADPVDISCSSTRPAVLHGIIPSASGLLLFSQNQQFLMFSADGNLTPSTALIRGLSNYRMDTKIDPVDTGTAVNFISKTHDTAGYTRIFSFQPQGIGQTPKVLDIGRVVSEYVPATITALTASPQNSFIAMYGTTLDNIYFYRTYNDGERDIVQAWFKWELPGNVHYVTVDSDTLYAIVKTGSSTTARYHLCSATMTQTPEETIIVTSEGTQINPHMDFYKVADAINEYPVETVTVTAGGSGYSGTPTVTIAAPTSGTQATATATVAGNAVTAITITNPGKGYDYANPPAVSFSGGGGSDAAATATVYNGSYCTQPFTNLTALKPVIMISGNASTNFSGATESGFTITPGRTTVNSVNYYTVPAKDLSASASDVYLGYKYSYDVTLPKLYFQKDPSGKLSDYTANLTVSRIKFSVAQSSIVGFKLKRKGFKASTQTFTGDGSTTAFSPDFKVKDKNDIIVKRNGAKQTLVTTFTGSSDERKSQYTISDHSALEDQITVTFGTAPSAAATAANVTTAADSVEIYNDYWFTLQPSQDANYYLADDVPLAAADSFSLYTVPVHQRSDTYTLRVYSDSPFPVALTSAAWEGTYSPRYYRRT